MTGFSRVEGNISSLGHAVIEIRSNNHRFLDVVCQLPVELSGLTARIKQEVRKAVSRGHIVCRLEISSDVLRKVKLDEKLLSQYYDSLKRIAKKFHLKKELSLSTLVSLPDVWGVESISYSQRDWLGLKKLLNRALKTLVEERKDEGRALLKDLLKHTNHLDKLLDIIKKRTNLVTKKRFSLYKTEEEKVNFLKSSDITEEIVRLDYHAKKFSEYLKSDKSVGKELDFILQEMQREANTAGAKTVDTLVSGKIVVLKSEIEKIREQVQNVE